MIEGLKVTVPGAEVKRLLEKKAEHHRLRASEYQAVVDRYAAAGITSDDDNKLSSQRDPVSEARSGVKRHQERERENLFLARWVNTQQAFLLDTTDLNRLGVLESRF